METCQQNGVPQTSQAAWQVLSQLCSQGQSPDTVLELLQLAVTLPFLPCPGELGRSKGFYSFIPSLLVKNSAGGAGSCLPITLGTELAPLAGKSNQQPFPRLVFQG